MKKQHPKILWNGKPQSARKARLKNLQVSRIVFGCLNIILLSAWGFPAHRHIVDVAIAWLPPSVQPFYKSHRNWLVEHALDADVRKHSVPAEGIRHYLDVDAYLEPGQDCNAVFPMEWKDALDKFGMDTLNSHGIGPWHAHKTYRRLVFAHMERDTALILRYSIDLAHYLTDLHVPLHTTANYNGQFSNQSGIHALWETQIPEAFQHDYALQPHKKALKCTYIDEVSTHIWERTLESYAASPFVFEREMEVRSGWDGGAVDAFIERGRTRQLMRTPEFVTAYHKALNGQVEERMLRSIHSVSSCWYSAWVDAGQPELHSTPIFSKPIWKKMLDWLIQ